MSCLRDRIFFAVERASPSAANVAALREPLRDAIPRDVRSLDRRAWLPQTELGHAGLDPREADQRERLAISEMRATLPWRGSGERYFGPRSGSRW